MFVIEKRGRLNFVYSVVIMSLLSSNVLGPIPWTFIRSSGLLKGPFCSRYCTIRSAYFGPTFFRRDISSTEAWLILIFLAPSPAHTAGIQVMKKVATRHNTNVRFVLLILSLFSSPLLSQDWVDRYDLASFNDYPSVFQPDGSQEMPWSIDDWKKGMASFMPWKGGLNLSSRWRRMWWKNDAGKSSQRLALQGFQKIRKLSYSCLVIHGLIERNRFCSLDQSRNCICGWASMHEILCESHHPFN